MLDRFTNMAFQWHQQFIAPLVRAANARDELAVNSASAQALAARDSGLLSPDEQLGLDLTLSYVSTVRYLTDDDRQAFAARYPETLSLLRQTEPRGPESDYVRRTYYVQLSILAALHGLAQLTIEEFRELIALVPERERWLEQWHFITSLAFVLGDYETVIAGYEAFLENHSTYQVGFLFRRYEVMSKIASGQALRLDAVKLIEDAALPGHISEVKRVFWPRFETLGLVDDELREMLAEKLAAHGYAPPPGSS